MVRIEFVIPVLFARGTPENGLFIRVYCSAHQNEVVNHMRTFKSSMLAGIGAVALAGAFVAPGIASAEAAGPLGSLGSLGSSHAAEPASPELDSETVTLTRTGGGELATYSATDLGNCKVKFTLTNGDDADKGVSWRVDYRVDNEDAYIGEADPDNPTAGVFRPVLTNSKSVVDAVDYYEIAKDEVIVDLTRDRTVPVNDNKETTTAPGVKPNEDGTHTVSFKMYSGSPSSAYVGNEDSVGEITVTGCPTESPLGSLGSLDVFGSIEGLFSTEQ